MEKENVSKMQLRMVALQTRETESEVDMNLFKKFKTKKQLRAEIERLQWRPPIINVERMDIQKLCASFLADNHLLDMVEADASEKYAKKRIAEELAQQIVSFIEYDVENCPYGKIYRGILRIAGKRI